MWYNLSDLARQRKETSVGLIHFSRILISSVLVFLFILYSIGALGFHCGIQKTISCASFQSLFYFYV